MSDIDDLFKVHRLNPQGLAAAEGIARAFTQLLRQLEAYSGPASGREMAIVRTKLQEASYYAKRAMAVNHTYQETP